MSSYSLTAVVLKRTDVGEADRIVTLFSREKGKITCVAKGARKLASSKLGALEPGCESKVYCVETKSLPILTQAQIIDEFSPCRQSLVTIKKLFQVLEIIDFLLPEGDQQEEVYEILLRILSTIAAPVSGAGEVRTMFNRIIAILGFEVDKESEVNHSIHSLVEELTSKKLKSFDYLTVT